jgi:F-box and WD-40 domain protein CDC4
MKMDSYHRPLSFSKRRGSAFNHDELILNTQNVKMPVTRPPRGPPTPSMSTPAGDFDQQLTGSPPPPPTPAASPGPTHAQPDWSDAAADEDVFLAKARQHFITLNAPAQQRLLADLLNLCTSQQLSFVSHFVSPLLKKDPFTTLPDELCLRVGKTCRNQLYHDLTNMTDLVLHRRPEGPRSRVTSFTKMARPSER